MLNIELVSMGSVNKLIVEPMEIFSVPLQKRSVRVIIVHNHPSGELKPSEMDKDITDRLIQRGLILHVPVLDHLIISEKAWYSFADEGLLAELEASTRYVPEYKLKEALKKQVTEELTKAVENKKALEMAKTMKAKGYKVEEIVELTELGRQVNRDV